MIMHMMYTHHKLTHAKCSEIFHIIIDEKMSTIQQSLLEKEEEIQKLKQKLSQNESNYLLILAHYFYRNISNRN